MTNFTTRGSHGPCSIDLVLESEVNNAPDAYHHGELESLRASLTELTKWVSAVAAELPDASQRRVVEKCTYGWSPVES